ncbi:hypothetical protein HD554DRAFT_172174 [Boletus coccyginus]|nr:hypothetical protein HD554DRAFT_172174 [Boletus coccyginus]
MTLALDTIHLYGCVQLYWQLLITCRRDPSLECSNRLSVAISLAVLMNYIIIFIVQCFYVQRAWIVTGRHKLVISLAVTTAVAGFIVGLVCSIFTFQQRTVQFIFTTPLTATSSVLSTICDAILTGSIVYFLRAGRSGEPERKFDKRGAGLIQQLRRVIINCGLLTCTVSLLTVLFYAVQRGEYWVEVTGVILSRSYINSMLAVLNTRQSIRDRDRDSRNRTIELPSIDII